MKRIITYCYCLLVLFTSCEKRSGETIIEEREVAAFKEIEVNDIFNIYISQDTMYSILVEGGENLLPNIITRVENGILKIDNENRLRWSRSYERINIMITVDTLQKIDLLEPSYIETLDTISGNYIEIFAISGMNEGKMVYDYNYINMVSSYTAGGKFTISGKVNLLRIELFNSMQLDAHHLSANNVDVMNNSIGDIYIHCTNSLKVRIYNDGNIYYGGNPQNIVEEIEGNGRLISLE